MQELGVRLPQECQRQTLFIQFYAVVSLVTALQTAVAAGDQVYSIALLTINSVLAVKVDLKTNLSTPPPCCPRNFRFGVLVTVNFQKWLGSLNPSIKTTKNVRGWHIVISSVEERAVLIML